MDSGYDIFAEQAEAYLNNEMTPQDQEDFKDRIAGDPLLAARFRDIQEVVQGLEAVSVKATMAEIMQAEKVPNRLKKPLAIAASVSLLVLCLLTILYFRTTESRLVKQYFEPYPDLVSLRNNKTKETQLLNGMNYYANAQYKQAIEPLSNAAENNDQKETAAFYLGVTYLAVNKYKEATQVLTAPVHSDSMYYQQVKWYLALAYLGGGEKDNALATLRKIREGEFKFPEAKGLIKQITKGDAP